VEAIATGPWPRRAAPILLEAPLVVNSPISRRTAFRAVQLVGLRGGGQALEFLGWVILARSLGVSNYGILSIGFFVARGLGLIADWGATVQGTRDIASGTDSENIHALSRWRLLLGVLLAAGFATATIAVGQWRLAPLALCVLGRGTARDWLALGGERHVRSSIPSLVQGTLVAAGALASSTVPAAASTLGVAYIAASVASLALNPLPEIEMRSRLRAQPGWYFAISLAEQIFLTADAFLIAWLLGSHSAGIYSAIYRFPNAWMTILGLAILSAVPSTVRRLKGDNEALIRYERRARSIGQLLAFAVVVTAPVLVLAVPLVFGDSYESGRVPMFILLLSTAVMAGSAGYSPIYYATCPERRLAAWTAATATVNVALNLVLLPTFELTGAAVATLVSQVLLSAFVVLSVRRHRTSQAAT
jgi:O-antigen/teichoic acid export membrane protein